MALTQVVNFLQQVDELDQAKSLLKVFEKYSNSLEQFDTLGMLYEKVKAYPEALCMLEKCIVLARSPEQMHSVRSNLAKVYNHINEPYKSLFYTNVNLGVNPEDHEALMEQTFSYYLAGDFEKSHQLQIDLLKNPNISENIKKRITFNMGTYEMEAGDFKSGIYKMIMGGKEIGIWLPIEKPWPKWRGEQTDKTVLVFAEAGIGDEMISIRFMPYFKDRGIKAIWIGHNRKIIDLFVSNGFHCIMNKDIDPFGEYVYCESMSLPVLLDLGKSELYKGPYLHAKAEYIEKWKAILPEKFVTIRWAGNPYYDQDLHRSIDFNVLVDKLSPVGIPLVSLQIDASRSEDPRIINVDVQSWDDTLAIQYLAYLNITSCTSTAHSASAQGARCVVLPPIATYYPWTDLRPDGTGNWYADTTRAYPQKKWKNWEETVNKAVEYLRTL